MEIITVDHRCPLVANYSGELTWFIVPVCERNIFSPDVGTELSCQLLLVVRFRNKRNPFKNYGL